MGFSGTPLLFNYVTERLLSVCVAQAERWSMLESPWRDWQKSRTLWISTSNRTSLIHCKGSVTRTSERYRYVDDVESMSGPTVFPPVPPPNLCVALIASASFEEAGRPPLGLRLQEKAPGQDPRWRAPTGPREVPRVKGSGRDEHVQPAGDWREDWFVSASWSCLFSF